MVERVRVWLEWPPDAADRLVDLSRAPRAGVALTFPARDEAWAVLRRLDVPPDAAAEIARAIPSPRTDPEAWWLLERLYARLVDTASPPSPPPWPAPVPRDDALSRYFHVYVFLAAVPHVLRLHARRRVPEDVTWETLGDLGLQVAHHASRHGRLGFDGAFWMWEHFRGEVFRLGRLLFDRTAAAVVLGGEELPALGTHIPALGPLTPGSCDDAFALARTFFARHFPEAGHRIATCRSWLMDEQLARYLAPDSNIVRFQRRFTLVDGWSRRGDDDVIRFVFGRLPPSLDDLPQQTSLERAVVTHLREGHHWRIRLGWFEL